jgi:hypothetical protein
MIDPDLHPLPITPNDPLSMVSILSIDFYCVSNSSQKWIIKNQSLR